MNKMMATKNRLAIQYIAINNLNVNGYAHCEIGYKLV